MKLMFNVCHQTCMRQDVQNAVADSVNYLTAKFTFETEDWNSTTKTAVFKNGPLVKNIILDANNECIVPAEVIDANYLYVSVFGVKEDNYRITTNFAMVQIDKSGFIEGDGAAELTPSLVEQLEGAIAEKTGPNDFKTVGGQNIVGKGDIPISGGGTEVIPNPTGEPTAELSKIEINGTIYAGLEGPKGDPGDDYVLTAQDKSDIADLVLAEIPEVEANPTLSGTEADLESIQIGDTKYKIPEGGSGSSTLNGLTDVNLSTPTNGQVLKYNSTSGKWENADESGGGGGSTDTVVDFGTVRTFCVVGDSYASGQIYKADLSNETVYALSWGQVLARMCGNTCINASFGGAMCSTWLSNSERGLAYLKSQSAQDLYLIQMGINDSRILGTAGLGDITDISSHEDYHDYGNTFYGNYGKIVAQIKEYAPSARIILMTFAYQWNATETAYNNAIKAIATYFEIPCIDVNTDSFYADNGWWDNERIANHPVALGYSAMARVNKKLIEQNMKNNASYWDTYGFASTPTPVQKELSSISVSVVPSSYSVGDYLGTVTVTATYSDSTTANVTASATVDTSNVDMSTAGTYTISAIYTEDGVTKTADTSITVGSVVTPTVIVDGVYDGTISSANGHCDDNTVTVGSKVSTYVYANMDSAVDGKGLMYKLTSDGGLDEAKGVGFSFEIVSTPAGGLPSSKDLKTTRPVALTADGQWHNLVNQNNTQMVGENGKAIRAGLWSTSDSTATFPVTIDNVHIQIGYV